MRIIRRIIFQLLCLLGACCYIPATAQVVLVDNEKLNPGLFYQKMTRLIKYQQIYFNCSFREFQVVHFPL